MIIVYWSVTDVPIVSYTFILIGIPLYRLQLCFNAQLLDEKYLILIKESKLRNHLADTAVQHLSRTLPYTRQNSHGICPLMYKNSLQCKE